MVWRFYVGDDCRWRWQKMSSDGSLVFTQSVESYDDYDECVGAARAAGYVFREAQQSSRRSLQARQFG